MASHARLEASGSSNGMRAALNQKEWLKEERRSKKKGSHRCPTQKVNTRRLEGMDSCGIQQIERVLSLSLPTRPVCGSN